MKKISILLALVVAMACVVGVASAAKKKTIKVSSEITLKFKAANSDDPYAEGGLFSGKVSTKKDECDENRKVEVFAKSGGRVGKSKTDKQGRYAIEADNVGPGKYFAEVNDRTVKKGKKKFECQGATSDRVVVG